MATAAEQLSKPHLERTVTEPRQDSLHPVWISQIDQVNPSVRLFRLGLYPPTDVTTTKHPLFHFLSGQWLDVHVPGIPQAGGFTITSTPQDALPNQTSTHVAQPYIELAVQESPSNPPAAWLWRPASEILSQQLKVRVGGSFIWPPPDLRSDEIRRVIFVAGGVGINPLMSMVSHIYQNPQTFPNAPSIHMLYSTRLVPPLKTSDEDGTTCGSRLNEILFLERLREITRISQGGKIPEKEQTPFPPFDLRLHITNSGLGDGDAYLSDNAFEDMKVYNCRISVADVRDIILGPGSTGGTQQSGTVCYVCGPPNMTDEFVKALEEMVGSGAEGKKRVFCEKWW
ncbi:hypothetical protein AJ80_01036 [Polytolypa hystricis UAMH7299]|uniref:FAD-binding FR-type domain-containing protein n=1 Tax=Polytolypa hystricis (strain UAMH7299) TaxID=1447883 RepID=A0A2B7Z066_POLH7|nr:hypothetical protein AJ80_01036 [Polytolypa hystricis UAMH7299]